MEKTLLIIKPDALARGLVGHVISRLEQKGLKLAGCKMAQLERSVLDEHYAHLVDKPFYERIAIFMGSLPVLLQCWEGVEAVSVVRTIAGVTNGREAAPGTIRGDLSMSVQCNLIHASDTLESAQAEIARFFGPSEIFNYQAPLEHLTYAYDELR
ncbi:MAG TPA: nucleoside-diphosphate kinase [Pyrinomonadaceae bacterium]|nr:nucleoside-diphosphate kinase [Pyrinomonadaceae bacterium]